MQVCILLVTRADTEGKFIIVYRSGRECRYLCRVNTVVPAGVDTEGLRDFGARLPAEYHDDYFSGRSMPGLIPR